MDQVKIGEFLRELRKEKELSQEQLAEKFNVSSRSVSRWENANTMPDISIIIELADFYEVDVREILNGERKSENMDKDMKETLNLVADYTNAEKEKLMKDIITMTAASATFFGILGVIVVFHLSRINSMFDTFGVFCSTLGLVYSVMAVLKLMQYNGKVSKKVHKKIVIGLIIAGAVIFAFSILAIMFSIGVFG